MANGAGAGGQFGDHWDGQTVTHNWDLPAPISPAAMSRVRGSRPPIANQMGLPQRQMTSPMPQMPNVKPNNLMR